MQCPACTDVSMTVQTIDHVQIETCPVCAGMWFDHEELRAAKDARLKEFHWFDLDLWKHDADFFGEPSGICCPDCDNHTTLQTITYDASTIHVDVCPTCHGIWLDRDEFEAILAYVQTAAEEAVLNDYLDTLANELDKALTGTGAERTALVDLVTLLDFFKYKFAVEHERLTRILTNLPR